MKRKRQIANRIAERLFTVLPNGPRADQLRLYRNGKYISGWAEKYCAYFILSILREEEDKETP